MKQAVKEKLKNNVIAVIRCDTNEISYLISEKLLQCGLDAVEITSTIPNFKNIILRLKSKFPKALVGAGTITSMEKAVLAKENGADFIVSPCIIKELGTYCRENDILCSMGGMTPTEVYLSKEYGSDIVKVFPGDVVGADYIKTLKGPFPDIDMMPTGGVSIDNMEKWFKNGVYAVGIGGYFTKNITENNLGDLEDKVNTLKNKVKSIF